MKNVLFLILVATVSATISTVTTTVVTTAIIATAIVATTVSTAIAATSTAAATVSATAAAISAAEAATVTCALSAGAGFVHNEVTAMESLPVGTFDSGTSAVVVGHFHKTEATAAVSGLVHDDLGRGHFAESRKKLLEVLVLCGVRNVGDVNVHEVYY